MKGEVPHLIIGFKHGSFNLIDIVGHPMSLIERILGNFRIWFSNLYSPTCEEVYVTIAFPFDSLMEGTSLEEATLEWSTLQGITSTVGATTLEGTTTLGDTTLEDTTTLEEKEEEEEDGDGTRGTRHVEERRSSYEEIKL